MLSVYKKILFAIISFVLISIFVTNLDNNFKNKSQLNICQQLNRDLAINDLNYTFKPPLPKEDDINQIERLSTKIIDNNNIETSFANISDNIFIYSAFETTNNIIVLIGFAKNCEQVSEDFNYYNYNNNYKVEDYEYFCGFGPRIQIRTKAEIVYLPESHDYYYSAIKVQCKRPLLFDQNLSINRVKLIERPKVFDKTNKTFVNNKTIESEFVFIVNNNEKHSNNSNYRLDNSKESIGGTGSHRTPRPSSASPKELVVCVRPLYGNISAINLLEFIAYYRINGINRFVFYNSISPRLMSNRTKQLFDLLSLTDFVEILPFLLSNNDETRPIIHANGQLTAIHDCLYRYSDSIQIHVDFDEYLMPLNNRTIKEFLLSEEISQSTALVVKTVLFCNEFKPLSPNSSDPLVITNFNRQKTPWPSEIRSKVIAMRAPLISQMGIHKVWELSPFYSHKSHPILYSRSNEIIIYHYRKCCDMIQPYFANIIHFHTINDYTVRDESMKPFVNRVKQFIDKYIEIIN